MHKVSYFLLILFCIFIDQISKWAVTEKVLRPLLADGGPSLSLMDWYLQTPERLPFLKLELLPFFNLVMVWNQGVSFGLFNHDSAMGAVLLSVLALLISAFFVVWLWRSTQPLQCAALSLVIAGALGNVIDRVRFGAVVDFLDVHAAGYHWPAFNVADSCICVGVFLLIIQSFFFESARKDAT